MHCDSFFTAYLKCDTLCADIVAANTPIL